VVELNDAALQIRPLQEKIPVAVASTISPSGMKGCRQVRRGRALGRYLLEEGLQALPTQWGFGETSAKENGHVLDSRKNWRILVNVHLSDSKERRCAKSPRAQELAKRLSGGNPRVAGR